MEALPDDIRRFVLTSIPSVPYLEAALLLRAAPHKHFSAAEVAAALYQPERQGQQLLQALEQGGLAARDTQEPPAYRYAPRDEALASAMDRLAEAYARNLVGVTHLIHDTTQKKAHRFADAFKLRKDR